MNAATRKIAALAAVLLLVGAMTGYLAAMSPFIPGRVTQTTTVTVARTLTETVTTRVVKVLTLGGPAMPDTMFYNGIVLTMEQDQPQAQALAVQGEKILALGSNDEILALRTADTQVVDLGGRVLLPGFVDSHSHLFNDAEMYLHMSLDEAQELALQNGITSLADMYVPPEFLKEMEAFAEQGELRIRTSLYLVYNTPCGVVESSLGDWYKQHRPTRQSGEMLRIGGVKIFSDGGSCGLPAVSYGTSSGNLWFTRDQLSRIVAEAHAAGYQVSIHAIGDRAVEQAQNAIQSALEGKPNDLRHRIEHNAIVRPELLARYGQIGVVLTVPGYGTTCRLVSGEEHHNSEQQSWILPHRAILAANPGLHVGWHSDYPWWGPINPLLHLYWLVTRNELAEDGTTVCRAPYWFAENSIQVEQALSLMNIGGAYAIFREEEIGSLRPGKFADLVVLSQNPLTVDRDMIKDVEVLVTMVGGRVEYCASGHETLCKSAKTAGSIGTSATRVNVGGFNTSVLSTTIIMATLLLRAIPLSLRPSSMVRQTRNVC